MLLVVDQFEEVVVQHTEVERRLFVALLYVLVTHDPAAANTDLLITGADVGASKLTKAEKLSVQVIDQGEIWQRLIAAGIT